MYSLSRACGSPLPLALRGRMVLLYPLTLGDLGAIEHYLLSNRLEAAVAFWAVSADAKGCLPEEHQKELAESCVIPLGTLVAFLGTKPGVVMSLWLGLRGYLDWEECNREVVSWSDSQIRHFVAIRDTMTGLDKLSEQEWAKLPPNIRDQMEKNGTLEEMVERQIKWKRNLAAAADMGKCNFADIHKLTLFQYFIMISDSKRLDDKIELPKGWNSSVSRKTPQGRQAIRDARATMMKQLKNTPPGKHLKVKEQGQRFV